MTSRSVGALAAGALLLAACAPGRAGRPPAPPPFDPAPFDPAQRAPAAATEAPVAPAESRPVPPTVPRPESTPAQDERAPEQDPAAPASAAPAKPVPTPLGTIAGVPLTAEELLLEWGDASSRELWLVLDKLVAARLAMAEADRLGIRLAPEAVEARFTSERTRLEQEIARNEKARTLAEFIEQKLGFEPARYLDRVRRATIRQMLAERAVRAASLAGETASVRLIVVAGDEAVETVRAALASGEDFAAVASAHSLDDSKERGGLVPIVVPEERSALARLAFETPVGATAGPVPIQEHHFWIRVEERRAPLAGDWATIEGPIEASLAAHPVGDAEFVQWKLAMERRYPIDLGPLFSLIGAAR